MKLQIERTLGIISAEIDLEPGRIVEVVGPNASGKTSIAVCAQAVLARESNPLGLNAADAKRSYPHDGADDATVALGTYDNAPGSATWYPSRGTIAADSEFAISNPEAVGLIDFTAKRGAKERAAVFQSALLPDPDTVLDAVKERLGEYLDPKDLAGAMEMLAERGWEATEAVYGDRGRTAKREWASITGRTYGVRVAADWRPDGWLADFDHMTVQIAEERVTNARDALNALHRVQAVTEAEQEAAERAAVGLPAKQREHDDLVAALTRAQDDANAVPVAAAKIAKDKLGDEWHQSQVAAPQSYDCPTCSEPLIFHDGRLTPLADWKQPQPREGLDAEIEAATAQHSTLLAEWGELDQQVQRLRTQANSVAVDVSTLERDSAKTGPVQTEADRAALARAEQDVEDARVVVRLVKAEADATRLHETIVRYTEIARALGPEGVRAKMLEKGLRTLNSGLRVIHDASKNANGLPTWPLVYVSENGSIYSTAYGTRERPIALCSESERWRAQAAIQLTLGAITGSKAVVLDRGDILDASNRAGLVCAVNRVASKTGMAVLLCSTGTPAADAPWTQIQVADGVVA